MAGYSGTPLPKKLGIKEGDRVVLVAAPEGASALLDPLPPGVQLLTRAVAPLDVAVAFVRTQADLRRRLPALAARMDQAGGLWIAWPKRSSGVVTDVSEDAVRAVGLAAGLVDNKVCAIDETWSGLRFVVRIRDRV